MNDYTERTGVKITLRELGWKWNAKLRRWEKGDVHAKTMYDAECIEQGLPPLPRKMKDFRK